MRRIERELVAFARFPVEVTFKRRAASGSEVQESGERFAAPCEKMLGQTCSEGEMELETYSE